MSNAKMAYTNFSSDFYNLALLQPIVKLEKSSPLIMNLIPNELIDHWTELQKTQLTLKCKLNWINDIWNKIM